MIPKIARLLAAARPSAIVVLGLLSSRAGADQAAQSGTPCSYPCKTSRPPVGQFDRTDVITVKFRDGLGLRVVSGKLVDLAGPAHATPAGDFAAINALPISRWEPVHEAGPAAMDALRAQAEASLGRHLPDLNLQLFVFLADRASADKTIDALNALGSVELALPVPLPIRPPTPPMLDSRQDYLGPAPGGISARTVWAWPGMGGQAHGVHIADVEYSWNLAHVDLPTSIAPIGPVGPDPFADNNHGTAVLGEIASLNNGWGTIGSAYGATVSVVTAMSTSNVYNLAGAVSRAATALSPGDVILIEQQIEGPNSDSTSPTTQIGYVPVEWYRPYYDAIVAAVGAGRIVIEAGANGQQNLDDPIYSTGNAGHYPFLAANDSGAIIVGAASPPRFGSSVDRSRLYFSNYGSAVRLQGYGEQVTTLAYGDYYSAEGVNSWYTYQFSGTSSASPIVTSSAALLQGIYLQAHFTPLTPAQLRAALVATGSPQQNGTYPASQHIGPRPDVRAAAFYVLGSADCNANGIPDALESLPVMPVAADVSARAGSAPVLSVMAPGQSGLSYRWQRNSVPLNDGPSGDGSTYAGTNTPTLTISFVRAVDAGTYVCVVENACPLRGSAPVTLAVDSSCPPDFNGDGGISPQDIFDFLSAWFAGGSNADFNQDGHVSVGDIFSFIGAWFAGCH